MDETNGVITQYTISYTDSDTGTVSTASTNSAALNTTLKGLHPFYRYTFKVRAETGGGPGPYSTETTIQLEEAGKWALTVVVIVTQVVRHFKHVST